MEETQHGIQTLTNETTSNKNQKHNHTEHKGKRTNLNNFRKQLLDWVRKDKYQKNYAQMLLHCQ